MITDEIAKEMKKKKEKNKKKTFGMTFCFVFVMYRQNPFNVKHLSNSKVCSLTKK